MYLPPVPPPPQQSVDLEDSGLHLNTIPESSSGSAPAGRSQHHRHARSRSWDWGRAPAGPPGSLLDVYPSRPARSSLDLPRLSSGPHADPLHAGRGIVRHASADNLLLQPEALRGRLNRIATRSSPVKFSRMHSCPSVSPAEQPLAIAIPGEGLLAEQVDPPPRHWSLPPDNTLRSQSWTGSSEAKDSGSRHGDYYFTVEQDIMLDVPSAVTPNIVTDKAAKDDQDDSGRGSEVTSVPTR